MRALKLAGLLALSVVIFAACGPSGTDNIKVAILAPLSGPVPTFGVSTRDGALLAIEEWNAKGGVLGKKITPIVEDSQCTPDPAVNAANKVIDQDKVHYIIGEVCSKASIPVSEIANAKKVIQISPTSTNPDVTVDKDGQGKAYIFRACFIDPFQGKVGAKFALDNLKAKNAFIMLDQANDYVKGLAEFFEKTFTAGGGKIVGKESYTAKDTDFSAILAKVAAAKPDVVYLPDYYNVVNLVTKQAKEKGITAPFMGGDGWDSSDLDKKAADGGYFTNHYSPEDQPGRGAELPQGVRRQVQGRQGTAEGSGCPRGPCLRCDQPAAPGHQERWRGRHGQGEGRPGQGSSSTGCPARSPRCQHNPVKSATILAVKDGKVQFDSVVNP